ncbi:MULTISPECIES: quinone-dependent dihydroorotate dehydrogenase [Okeania]|uniref:quinone-dependent dihydroorotate dehydrogenase n=1 Tax=Okeania TaxID=1458928 RepID=UPI000F530059|nr:MULTISPECIES: quinone-dependent dihydroorotate dehydrogenase [Okeania]NES78192.1 quinone-dependent dihydroorotate dehydrogenase [Okeania sp. SIO1H4]NET18746.1 quinone-dependent dihydroorotate dehydrogenase [Okeania sp. SIO1H5]NET78341.1 quinone-dependent dihydroorotate dehydrogenase [Okeania sp. SIO1F9]NET97499.1 quinone-dependent dihydroorotate dehydrogenase [Okeania sp. SIO1H2]RQH12263.1 quinone-dependent dihydroorotate dehydrogenase [Okeania hirsuta]
MLNIYRSVIFPTLFSGLKADPEWVHHQLLNILSFMDTNSSSKLISSLQTIMQKSLCFEDIRLEQTLWGLNFKNPVGLAAGYDKDGVAINAWPQLGFGFAELGTVTLHQQPGNPQPRLFRLPMDRAALNRMGFNNQGAAALAMRLQSQGKNIPEVLRLQENNYSFYPNFFPYGINIGKSKITSLEAAATDYLGSFKLLKDWGDYFVVNVSSPNTPGLRSLQNTENLSNILADLQAENKGVKPILVKIAPDLEKEAIASILDLIKQYQISGIIATNTTISRDELKTKIIAKTGKLVTEEAGGISGAPLTQRATEIIKFIWQETQGKLPIIGVGGIFTVEDAWDKITAGASLIQVYTGWVYQGPGMVKQILQGLLQKLDERGLNSISEAIGLAHKGNRE